MTQNALEALLYVQPTYNILNGILCCDNLKVIRLLFLILSISGKIQDSAKIVSPFYFVGTDPHSCLTLTCG